MGAGGVEAEAEEDGPGADTDADVDVDADVDADTGFDVETPGGEWFKVDGREYDGLNTFEDRLGEVSLEGDCEVDRVGD